MATTTTPAERPTLWQLQVSHYNEKVRWALDYKRISHTRRSLLPGVHRFVAQRLSGTETTPVLTIGEESIGDSTAIIAELERRWPEPPLYPADTAERERALELEDFFDEQLGPHTRRLVWFWLLDHPDIVVPLFTNGQPPVGDAFVRTSYPALKLALRKTLNINEQSAARSRDKVIAALERLEAELDGRDYTVRERFSVADLTAAALLYPLARTPEFPYPSVERFPPEAQEFIDSLSERPGIRWVTEMYRRHREPR